LSRGRGEPPRACGLTRSGTPMTAHRRDLRPRYGRIVALATSVTVSAVAALAGLGVLTTAQAGPSAAPASYHHSKPPVTAESTPPPTGQETQQTSSESPVGPPQGTSASADAAVVTALPAASGHGRRI